MKYTGSELAKEVTFKTSRSGGSGGQNVNKVSTKVEVLFHIGQSFLLTAEEKLLLMQRLASRIDNDGFLHVVSQEERSQLLNKQRAMLKLQNLINNGITIQKPRKATKVPKKAKEKRLDSK